MTDSFWQELLEMLGIEVKQEFLDISDEKELQQVVATALKNFCREFQTDDPRLDFSILYVYALAPVSQLKGVQSHFNLPNQSITPVQPNTCLSQNIDPAKIAAMHINAISSGGEKEEEPEEEKKEKKVLSATEIQALRGEAFWDYIFASDSFGVGRQEALEVAEVLNQRVRPKDPTTRQECALSFELGHPDHIPLFRTLVRGEVVGAAVLPNEVILARKLLPPIVWDFDVCEKGSAGKEEKEPKETKKRAAVGEGDAPDKTNKSAKIEMS